MYTSLHRSSYCYTKQLYSLLPGGGQCKTTCTGLEMWVLYSQTFMQKMKFHWFCMASELVNLKQFAPDQPLAPRIRYR